MRVDLATVVRHLDRLVVMLVVHVLSLLHQLSVHTLFALLLLAYLLVPTRITHIQITYTIKNLRIVNHDFRHF